jgi:hypothetical protein
MGQGSTGQNTDGCFLSQAMMKRMPSSLGMQTQSFVLDVIHRGHPAGHFLLTHRLEHLHCAGSRGTQVRQEASALATHLGSVESAIAAELQQLLEEGLVLQQYLLAGPGGGEVGQSAHSVLVAIVKLHTTQENKRVDAVVLAQHFRHVLLHGKITKNLSCNCLTLTLPTHSHGQNRSDGTSNLRGGQLQSSLRQRNGLEIHDRGGRRADTAELVLDVAEYSAEWKPISAQAISFDNVRAVTIFKDIELEFTTSRAAKIDTLPLEQGKKENIRDREPWVKSVSVRRWRREGSKQVGYKITTKCGKDTNLLCICRGRTRRKSLKHWTNRN